MWIKIIFPWQFQFLQFHKNTHPFLFSFDFLFLCWSFENSNRFSKFIGMFVVKLICDTQFDIWQFSTSKTFERRRREKNIKINKAQTQTKYLSIHHFYQFRKQFGCCLVLFDFFFFSPQFFSSILIWLRLKASTWNVI